MKTVDLDSAAYGFRPDAASLSPERKKSREKEKTGQFLSMLNSVIEDTAIEQTTDSEVFTRNLEKSIDEIHSLGEELARHPGTQTIQQYKKAIKKLLHMYHDKAIKTEKQVSNRNVLEQKQYQIIKSADEKLEKLVVGILQSQYTQFEILSKIEEIQGLLVNLLH
jgi:uncharacterized protein YaaR (DUF327 family)